MSNFSGQLKHIVSRGRRFRTGTYLAGLALLVGIVALGCSQGSYPLDIFYEMHYQPSYKAHEPPRLSAPASAVPYFAPQAANTSYDGQRLFEVNCSMCHGAQGRGDGPVLTTMMEDYGYKPSVPPDLTSLDDPLMIAKDTAGVVNIMTGGLTVMPSFSKLLSPEEIDAVAQYVVDCLQEQNMQMCR